MKRQISWSSIPPISMFKVFGEKFAIIKHVKDNEVRFCEKSEKNP